MGISIGHHEVYFILIKFNFSWCHFCLRLQKIATMSLKCGYSIIEIIIITAFIDKKSGNII